MCAGASWWDELRGCKGGAFSADAGGDDSQASEASGETGSIPEEEGQEMSEIKLGPLHLVPNDNTEEITLVTLRCLLKALEMHDSNLHAYPVKTQGV